MPFKIDNFDYVFYFVFFPFILYIIFFVKQIF